MHLWVKWSLTVLVQPHKRRAYQDQFGKVKIWWSSVLMETWREMWRSSRHSCTLDDFLYGGSAKFEQLMAKIKVIFTVGSQETVSMKYLGINIEELNDEVSFSQDSYSIYRLFRWSRTSRQERYCKSRLLNAKEYRYWISTQSRADISFDVHEQYTVCQLSAKLNSATVQDTCILQANKVLRKVKQSRDSL